MIKVSNLSKVYRVYDKPSDRLKEILFFKTKERMHKEFQALKDITFEIGNGETIGIIGKNGSGKSTLLKILSGVLTPSSGSVKIDGKVAAILELGAGFNVEYTGIENIYLNGTLQGKTKAEIDAKIDDILRFADIGEFINQPVKTYSSGMFARLAFAVAINVDPDILIVDEALAVGDMKFQTKCFRKFEELKENGVTILFVGHDVSSIRKFCDRTLWLNQGEMVAIGDTLAVTAQYMEFMNSDTVVENTGDLKEAIDLDYLKDEDYREKSTLDDAINRWGSQPHLIQTVEIINEKGQLTNVIRHGEIIRINVKFKFPQTLDRDNVSVAVSIKNTMGLDLLVFTSHDDKKNKLDFADNNEVVFEFTNYFTEGEFVLVVAIEDRSSIQPQYYDFIEGACFIKCITEANCLELYVPQFGNI